MARPTRLRRTPLQPEAITLLFTCHLTKLETAVEQVRKAYPKLVPADCALLASAVVLSGRHALAVYEGEQYAWPEDYSRLTQALSKQIEQIQVGVEPKKSRSAPEEEPIMVTLGLIPNYSAGEKSLVDHKDLQALFSDLIQEGVEYMYSATDVGWQWAVDRANWSTVSGGELARRIKIKANFSEGAVGIEMGSVPKKRPSRAAKVAEVADVEEAPAVEEVIEEE